MDKIVKNIYWNYDSQYNDRLGFFGFMDYVRGCLSMFYICKENNWYFEADYSNHSIAKYLINNNSKYSEIKSKGKIFFLEQRNYDAVKNFIRENDVAMFFTNLWYDIEPLTEDAKMFIKSSFIPNEFLQLKINETMENLNLINGEFNCIHIRMGDNKLVYNNIINETKYDEVGNIIFDKLREIKYTKNIIISDDYDAKKYIANKYGYEYIDNIPCHVGNIKNQNDVINTLIDYFIMSKAANIITYSIYGGSGFSHWCSKIFDIKLI